MDEYFTFQQARAHIAHTAHLYYTRDQVIAFLHQLGYTQPIDPFLSDLSVCYKLAWLLLPAGGFTRWCYA